MKVKGKRQKVKRLGILIACAAMAQTMPPGITRTQLLDNASVMVARLNMAPGARETVHTHPFSAVVIQLTTGEVEMRVGTRRETAQRGQEHIEFIAAEIPHAAANVGKAPFDVITIALKPDRVRGGTQPSAEAPPGIDRKQLLDNNDARATRVVFEPGAREPVHSHPFDLVLVQLNPGRMEVLVGTNKTARNYGAGEVVFLPRDVPHAVANVDTSKFDVMSVAVK
jgi:quercetin dioxygenase-like cupin family protein